MALTSEISYNYVSAQSLVLSRPALRPGGTSMHRAY